MARSQNGWPANDASLTSSRLVPGTTVKLRVRNDAAGDLLLEVASAFDRLVEDIDNARGALDDWGYAERPIRGGSALSNHASGTAIDLNAPKHPLGTNPSANFTAAQIGMVRQIVAVTGGVVRWGGDYSGRKDPMHFEINDGRTEAACVRALAAIREFNGREVSSAQEGDVLIPTLREGDGRRGTERGRLRWYVTSLQALLNVRGLGGAVTATGEFDAATAELVRKLQARSGLAVDGVVGPATWPWVLGNDAPEFAA